MTIPSSRSLIFEVKSTESESPSAVFGRCFGRLRNSSGMFGNDRVVFKNPSTPRIKISRLYLRKSWQVYHGGSLISRSQETKLPFSLPCISPSYWASQIPLQVQTCEHQMYVNQSHSVTPAGHACMLIFFPIKGISGHLESHLPFGSLFSRFLWLWFKQANIIPI